MDDFRRVFGGSTGERSEVTGGKKKSAYDAIKGGDKATADQLKPLSKMSQWITPNESSSLVDNTSVLRKSTSLEGSFKESLEKH